MLGHTGRSAQDAQAHPRNPFRRTGCRGSAAISGQASRQLAGMYAGDWPDLGRHRGSYWQRKRLGSCPLMKLLLDTHIWIWSVLDPNRLSARVSKEMTRCENQLWLS